MESGPEDEHDGTMQLRNRPKPCQSHSQICVQATDARSQRQDLTGPSSERVVLPANSGVPTADPQAYA